MDPAYVESVWWALKQIYDKGLLVEDYRVAPYCPRCGTGLSDHELAQGYETVTDPSVYVRFPLTSGPYAGTGRRCWSGRRRRGRWSPTPPSPSTPTSTYVVATDGTETLVVAEPLFDAGARRGLDGARTGSPAPDMERWTYQRPLRAASTSRERRARRTSWCSPTTSPPRTAPGWCTSPPPSARTTWRSAARYGLPVVEPGAARRPLRRRRAAGRRRSSSSTPTPTWCSDLEARGLLFRHVAYEHTYPHCWRCHTALHLLRAAVLVRPHHRRSRTRCSRENEKTNWYPETIKWGRYGDWLHNNIDWALSRSRYWGTPLPIWRCAEDHQTCVGSLAELVRADRHRPVRARPAPAVRRRRHLRLPGRCGGEARRVPEVIDAWFDCGSMPFAQWGYPHVEGSDGAVRAGLPGRLHLRGDRPDPRLVLHADGGRHAGVRPSRRTRTCSASGHILAEDGRKMSKHLGNILEPMPLMDEHGADAVRWFMAASGSPWAARRVGHAALQEIVRKVLLTYWNTVAFQVLYARTNGLDAGRRRRPRWRTGRCWTGGRCREAHRLVAGRHRGARGLRHPAGRARCSRRSSTTCRTGTSAAPAAASGTATRRRWRRCTSACTS